MILDQFQTTRNVMHYLYFILLFLIPSHISSSFLYGTLVKTSEGLRAVERLSIGQKVYSCVDSEENDPKIASIELDTTDAIVIINTTKGALWTSKEQLLFDPVLKQWIHAFNLTSDHILITAQQEHVRCLDINVIEVVADVYKVKLDDFSLMFISSSEILVGAPLIDNK